MRQTLSVSSAQAEKSCSLFLSSLLSAVGVTECAGCESGVNLMPALTSPSILTPKRGKAGERGE